MERSKVKNVVILILLAVDLALGYMLLSESISAKRIDDRARENLVQVLERDGIALMCAVPDNENIYAIEAVRGTDSEKRTAESLVGSCVMEDQGGNIHCYRGEKGDVYFRGSGEFEVIFGEEADLGSVIRALKKQNVQIDQREGEDYACTGYQFVNGRVLRNSTVTLRVSGGKPTALEGRWLISPVQQDMSAPGADVLTAIMYFASENADSGYGCTEIKSVEPGYYMTAQVSGEFALEPVWDIETDVGCFRVNGSDLHVEQVRN